MESLTRELEERAWELIERIDELGGAVAAVEQGFSSARSRRPPTSFERQIEAGERVVVGVNRFAEDDEEEMELHRLDPEAERRQVERTRARPGGARRCRGGGGARAGAGGGARRRQSARPRSARRSQLTSTVGEVCNALRDEFGTYDAPSAP